MERQERQWSGRSGSGAAGHPLLPAGAAVERQDTHFCQENWSGRTPTSATFDATLLAQCPTRRGTPTSCESIESLPCSRWSRINSSTRALRRMQPTLARTRSLALSANEVDAC